MAIIKDYIEYLKDNPNHYWFKRRLYGWGWAPATWQGWFVILIFIVLLVAVLIQSNFGPDTTNEDLINYFVKVILLIVALIIVCYKKGEKPKWQWGLPKNDRINK